ncbi:MAG: STAS domain-containing protein [Clostridia bacterium]|nr:STAS domain-containing protein [Clostridia bacterium]
MLNINKTSENGKARFALEGRLDTVTAPELEAALQESIAGVGELTLDLEKLEYVSSAGLRVLLSTQKAMAKQGEMKLINVSEPIMEIFDITGFSEILTIE